MSKKKNLEAVAEKGKQEFSLISNETLLELYRGLLKERAAGESSNGSRRGKKHGWAFDAAAVAVSQDLVSEDAVIAESAADVLRMMPVNGRSHIGAPPKFAYELERAVGTALAQKTKKSGKVTVVFGGVEHGHVWTEALEIARANRLPMIFVSGLCEEAAERRGTHKTNSAELQPGTEMARIIVDGHDVVASYRVAHEAIERARKGRGPTLMECTEFRIPGRRRQDAVAGMESYLRGKGLLDRGAKREMLDVIAHELHLKKL